MHHRSPVERVLLFISILVAASPASAEVIEFGEGQKDAWIAAAGDFTTIPFTEFPHGTIIADEYSHLGIHFVNGGVIVEPDWEAFPEDGAGFKGPPVSPIRLAFALPVTHIAIDFPSEAVFELYADGNLLYVSDEFGLPGFAGHFAGLVSTDPFDEAWIVPPQGSMWLDNLHFGPPIPVPPMSLAIGLVLLPARRRRMM